MKILLSILCLLFCFQLIAQKDSLPCATIVLENDKEIPARIDSITSSHLFYKKCIDANDRQYTIPISYIKSISDPKGDHVLTNLNTPSQSANNSIDNQGGSQNIKLYNTWVYLSNEPYLVDGYFYAMKDSSILISDSNSKRDYFRSNFNTVELQIKDIKTIKTRRKGNKGRGVLIGALTGLAIGVITGFAVGDDPPCTGYYFICSPVSAETKAFLLGSTFAAVGAGLGALMGSMKVTIPLNGNTKNYHRHHSELKRYAIIK